MRTISYDIAVEPTCPACKTVFPWSRIIQQNDGAATAHCGCCGSSTRILLPEVTKKLIYLDQSFLSDAWHAINSQDEGLVKRILTKLIELKAHQRIFVIISEIHCAETFAIPDENAKKREELWAFENKLADGIIAVDGTEVFLQQQRRALLSPLAPECFPPSDIGLKDPYRIHIGQRILMTNTWRGRLHKETAASRDQVNAQLRDILERQASAMGMPSKKEDCLNHVRQQWRKDLLDGITAMRQRAAYLTAIEQFVVTSVNPLFKLAEPACPPFRTIVAQIVEGLGDDALSRLERLLEQDPNGGCARVRMHTALEAEVLWSWCSTDRSSSKTFKDRKFGLSRLNDIDHVSTFLPYVDALTTDNDMANLCRRDVARLEVESAKGKLFSGDTYAEFEAWLDNLARQPLEYCR